MSTIPPQIPPRRTPLGHEIAAVVAHQKPADLRRRVADHSRRVAAEIAPVVTRIVQPEGAPK